MNDFNGMNELEWLRKRGVLITKKQYKILLLKMYFLVIMSCLITLSGMAIMIFSEKESLIIAGVSIFIAGFIFMIFCFFYVMCRYAVKLQTYRDFKKRPEYYVSKEVIEDYKQKHPDEEIL